LLSTTARDIVISTRDDGVIQLGGQEPTIASRNVQLTGSSEPLRITSLSGSNGNVTLQPDGSGVVQLKTMTPTGDSTISSSGIFSIQGASTATAPDLLIGPESETDIFMVRVVSDSTSISVAAGNDSDSITARGTGVSPFLTLESSTGTVSVDSTTNQVDITGEKELKLSAAQDVDIDAGSGVVLVGGDQNIVGDTSSSQLRFQGFASPSAGNAPMSLGAVSDDDEVTVEISCSESVAGDQYYGLTSTVGKSLTLSTRTAGTDIELSPHGEGAVVFDDMIQLPVLSSTPSCTSDAGDDGKMWVEGDYVYACVSGSIRQLAVEAF